MQFSMRPSPTLLLRASGALLMALALALLAACAQPPRPPSPPGSAAHWEGRMALSVEGDAKQSLSAAFALDGDRTAGSLTLSTPLGTLLAEMRWTPGHAELRSPQGDRTAESLDALLNDALGTPIPVEALFAWLRGDAATAAGWQADVSRLDEGLLTAVRSEPLPRTSLRVVLDR